VPLYARGLSSRLGDDASDDWQASFATLESIAKVGVSVAVYSWWLLPLAAVGAFVLRRVLRTDRDRRERGAAHPAAAAAAANAAAPPVDGDARGSVDTPSEPT